jgi:hypothetical protein
MKAPNAISAAWLALALAFATVGPLALTGCKTIGIHAPESFNERMVAGYATVQAIADSTALLLDAGEITADDARNIHTQATTAKEGLDIARQIHDSGDITSAEGRLQAIITGLTAVQTYLRSKQ